MKDFEILYNALSVGWHLAKLKEAAPDLLKDPKEFERFLGWLERHKLTPNGKKRTKKA